jgi:hypothetical protein
LLFRTSRMSSTFGAPIRADASGHFEVKALPLGRQYMIWVSAKRYGREQRVVEESDPDSRRTVLEGFQLPLANLRIAGVVVDDNDKPVSGVSISVSGQKQASVSGQSDSKGHFSFNQVSAGQVRLFAYDQRGTSGNATAEGGDTNITVRLARSGSVRSAEPRPVALKGKPLPDLAPLGLTAADCPADKPVLALLIDAEQRPSRRALTLLGNQADAIKQKGVAVVVLQTGTMADDAFADWKKDAASPFPIGSIKTDPEKARAAWGAAALPWLILTDKSHRVIAEGFTAEELDAKLQALPKP